MGTVSEDVFVLTPPEAITSATDDGSAVTEFHITGFGRFHNVPVNPTQQIVEGLPSYLASHPLRKGCLVASTSVLEVSAETSTQKVRSLYDQIVRSKQSVLASSNSRKRRVVFVHLGLNVRIKNFQLEIQGRNEATFSCPDEKGWSPIKRPVDETNPDISAICRTTLRLDELVDMLTERNFGVEISTDAGKFVCNWLYYNSLQLATKLSACALFVHTPPTSVISLERQLHFFASLLECISIMT